MMNELLGFIVLSGPLLLILLWLPVSLWIAFKVSKRFTQPGKKLAVGISLFILTLLLPFADEIIGRIYFNHLCTTQAGVKVYQTVELPAEYWDGEGRARFYASFDSLLGDTYSVKYKQGSRAPFFNIDHAGYVYSNGQSGQVLGEAIDFRHWGGWIRRNFSPSESATSCLNYSDPSNRLIDRIFIRKHSKSK